MRLNADQVCYPAVIAHRGASGYLPEHTLTAKALAHEQGADFLEQDVVATRDRRLIVCHDLTLERVTDVASAYPGRARADGRYYVIDFDWDEIASLQVVLDPQSRQEPLRDDMRISTFEDELEAIRGWNRDAGREAGVYPEIKEPRWHAEHGIDLTKSVLGVLHDFGYRDASSKAFVQCFDATALRRCREELDSALRLIQLIARDADPFHLTPAGLAAISGYASGIGLNYRRLFDAGATGRIVTSPVVEWVREAGLLLHPYTFSRDGLPDYAEDLEGLLELVFERIRPDGVFCDYPDVAVKLRRRFGRGAPSKQY
jgi:glycerophosphoryl diester phosphodiesterase